VNEPPRPLDFEETVEALMRLHGQSVAVSISQQDEPRIAWLHGVLLRPIPVDGSGSPVEVGDSAEIEFFVEPPGDETDFSQRMMRMSGFRIVRERFVEGYSVGDEVGVFFKAGDSVVSVERFIAIEVSSERGWPESSAGERPVAKEDAGLLPVAGRRIVATFKCEDSDAASGEDVGPLILSDLDTFAVCGEVEWMRKSEAKALAAEYGWQFTEDC
jgi:hypothetical protein